MFAEKENNIKALHYALEFGLTETAEAIKLSENTLSIFIRCTKEKNRNSLS